MPSVSQRKWKYATHRPSETHEDQDEILRPGHRMGWKKRTDPLIPRGGPIGYQAYCMCKWRDDRWVPLRALKSRFAKHIMEVDKQGRLDVV